MRVIGRPLAVCCAVFMTSCVAGYFLSEYIIYTIAAVGALSLLSLLLFAFFRGETVGRAALIMTFSSLFSLAALLITYMSFVQSEKKLIVFYNREVDITACCTSVVNRNSFSARYTAETISIDGGEERMGILLITSGDILEVGDTFSARVTLHALTDDGDTFDEYTFFGGKGIRAEAVTCEETKLSLLPEKKTVLRAFDRIKNSVTSSFGALLDERSASFFSAVFAGDRSYMSDADTLSVRRSGVSHLLAVSGMHFSVIMGIAYFFIRSIGMRTKPRYAALALIAFVYAGSTGFSPPVIRSGIMLLLTYAGAVAGKRTDPLTSLLCAGAAMFAMRPYYILSSSFWLSFSATLGVVMLSPVLGELFEQRHKSELSVILKDPALCLRRRIFDSVIEYTRESIRAFPALLIGSVMVSVSATAFSMPFGILFFGSVSYASVPAGIILSPVVSLALMLAPMILLLGTLTPVSAFGNLLGQAFFTITHFFSEIKGVYRNVDYSAVQLSLLLLLITALVIMLFTKKKILPFAVCAAAVVMVFAISYISENIEFADIQATALCTGENDSVALRSERGLVIADMGSDGARDIDECMISLSELKENEISAYIFTSVSGKQEGVVRYLLANYSVECIYLPDYAAHHMKVIADSARAEAERAGARVKYFRFGEEFTVDGYTMCVSELEFLERSVRPLFCVSAASERGSVLWVSSAFFEGDKCASLGGAYYDRIIFGTYGPKYKKKITDVFDYAECSEFIAFSQEIEEYVRPEQGEGNRIPFLVSSCVKFGLSAGNSKIIP